LLPGALDKRVVRAWSVGGSHPHSRGVAMTAESPVLNTRLTRALCIVVFLVMLIAVLYGAWIGISNYSRIHV
jgi:hypothetical protein